MQLTHRSVRAAAATLAVALVATLTGVATSSDGSAPPARAAAVTPGSIAGLKVLLTNDDSARFADTTYGTDGKGLYELRKALCAAGADVLVVAPWRQQSGAGGRMSVPGFSPVPLTVQAVTPPAAYAEDCASASAAGAVFGVCAAAAPCDSSSTSASPADAVYVAVRRFAATYWSSGPDVVLSGVNFGQNVGATLNHSGTVGAAVTAAENGVAAIALSAEVPFSLADIPNVPFTQTSAYAVSLLQQLVGAGRLKPSLLLNVNYPFVGAGEQLGKAVTTVAGSSDLLGLTYGGDVPKTGGTYQLSAGAAAAETRAGADTAALKANKISVTQLDGDWTLPGGEDLVGLLDGTATPPTPPTTPAVEPVRTSLHAAAGPVRDRTRPYRTVVRGSLEGAKACAGEVVLAASGTVRAHGVRGRVVVEGGRTVALASGPQGCRFSGPVTITPRRDALAKRSLTGVVTVRARFTGTDGSAPSWTRVTVFLG
jgi:5'/3'-nucleotidase